MNNHDVKERLTGLIKDLAVAYSFIGTTDKNEAYLRKAKALTGLADSIESTPDSEPYFDEIAADYPGGNFELKELTFGVEGVTFELRPKNE